MNERGTKSRRQGERARAPKLADAAHGRDLPSSSSSSSTGVDGRARLLSPVDAASGGPFRFT